MPPVLEAPQLRPPRQRRKSTWAHRTAVTFVRLVILGLILGVGGVGYYLAKRGFGRQWRDRVVEELRKHGVEANIGRLTLDPFRGLIAKNVRIFDYKNHENIWPSLARSRSISITRRSSIMSRFSTHSTCGMRKLFF